MDTDAYPHYKESSKQTQEPVQKSGRPEATILRTDLTNNHRTSQKTGKTGLCTDVYTEASLTKYLDMTYS